MFSRFGIRAASVALPLFLLAACGKDGQEAKANGNAADRPIPVTTRVVQPSAWSDTLQALGTAKARESVILTAKVSEIVQDVHFESGQQVAAGQTLITLKGDAAQAALVQAEATYAEADRLYRRQKELADQQLIARSGLDTQLALRNVAAARVRQAKADIGDRSIRAPFAGVLGIRQVSPGSLITANSAIATLDDISRMYVDFQVPEAALATVGIGNAVNATAAAYPGESFEGKVETVDTRIDPNTRAVNVRAVFANADRKLRPGMLLDVRLFRPERQALVIPEIAVVQVGRDSFVYRVTADGSVEQAAITSGVRREGQVEIVQGVKAGERIVIDGTGKLRPGAKVTDAKPPAAPASAPATDGKGLSAMKLSDISIKRPVLAVVMSLLLIVLGVMSFMRLTLRELPNIDPPIVSVDVTYPGASAAVVETRVTQILEDALSGIEGINTIQSRSVNGRSQVTIEFNLTRDIEAAANDVRDAVSRVMDRMPEEADPPEVEKVEADAEVIVWLNMRSTVMDTMQLTDYADRYIVDRLSALDGVARVQLGGGQRYAMRIWLDRDAMAARGITASDIETALRVQNVELPAGRIESDTRDFTLRVERGYQQPAQFEQIPLGKGADGYVVRLGDVARAELGPEERRSYLRSNGVPNVGLGIVRTSTANALDVARAARAEADRIRPSLPKGTEIFVAFDSTVFIEASVERVYWTLVEALVLVFLVIWLFLGSLRAALIPAVTVPVCLVASFIALYAFGFTINLLTLLALVLCIGLVVDDAIVVLENIQRRADLGEPPLVAARRGTTQVAFAVIATTAVLVAVFLPVGFMDGNAGRLFRELSVALAAAVAISAFVALTLTPMMSSKLVRPHTEPRGLNAWTNRTLNRISEGYGRQVGRLVAMPGRRILGLMLLAMGACLAAMVVLGLRVPSELSPAEDRGRFFISIQGPEGAGFDYTVEQVQQVERIVGAQIGEDKPIQRANSRVPGGFGASEEMHSGMVVVFLQDWDKRKTSTDDVVTRLRGQLGELPGIQARPQVPSGLLSGRGQPYQLVLGGPDYGELAGWRDRVMARIEKNPGLFGADSDYKETRPQMRVNIDRNRAADLGVSVQEIGRTLETMMGSRQVTTFVDNGEEYDVMLQADREKRASPADLTNTYVRGAGDQLIPLSNLVTLSEVAEPGSFNRFNRLRAITISAGLSPGYTMGEAIAWTQQVVAEELPDHAQVDWKGESREYLRAGGAILLTFTLALLIVYLVLAAQFESFIHPLVIMLTVPLAVLGALIGLWVTGGTLNLFSQIGIVMLIGLAAKNGILIVEFANQLRDDGMSVARAISESAKVRLRPILMTSVATVVGAVPLVAAGGPGSASRATIGVVVIFGVAFSTLLSLYVVPAFYALLAPFTKSPEAVAHELDKLEAETPAVGGHG